MLECITEPGMPLQKAFNIDNLGCIFLEPAVCQVKRIEHKLERVGENYCIRQREHVTVILENRTGHSKIKCIGINVSRSCPITDYYTTKITNQITITTFYMATVTNQITITSFSHISPIQLIARLLANQIPVIFHSM